MATGTQSIREIIAQQSSAAAILQRFDLDLCGQAEISLEQACAEIQLSVDQVLERLSDGEASERGDGAPDPLQMSTARLIQHIVRAHHSKVRRETPGLAAMAQKLAEKRGDQAPELKRVSELVATLRDELLAHIEKEEQVLFPYVMRIEEQIDFGGAAEHVCFRSVTQPIAMMMREHDDAGVLFLELHKLTNDFELPAWACNTHRALFAGLQAFEQDLRRHVYLEDEVLFPRAIALEAEPEYRRER